MLNVLKQHLCMSDCELEGLKSTLEPKRCKKKRKKENKISAITIRVLRNKPIKSENTELAGRSVLYCYLKPSENM